MKKALFITLFTLVGICVAGSTEVFAQDTPPTVDYPWVSPALYIAYALVIIAAVATIVLPMIQAAGDPKSLITTGVGVAAILVVFLIGYAISGNEVRPTYAPFGVGESGSKLIGGGLIASYLLVFIALAGIVYTEVTGIFNRN